jgi:hypothetical protein
MRATAIRVLCLVTLITAGLAVPLASAAAAKDISKPVSANGPALKLTFTTVGQNGALTFSGIKNQVVSVNTSAGTYAANCDVMVSVLKKTTTVAGPVCGGISGTTGNINLSSDATYTIKVDTQNHTPATLKVAVTSTGAIKSITPNAAAVTFAVPASSTTDFGFIVKTGQRLSATTAAGTFATDCQVRVYVVAPDKTTVLGSDLCAGQSGYVAALNGIGAGSYVLRIQNTAAPTGSVNLQVFQFTDKTAAITANGPAVTATDAWPGQRSSLTFAGTNGQKISWRVVASDLTGFVELHRPDGSYAGSYISSNTNAFQDAVTLTVDGTWTLLVYSNTADTGSVTVQLYTFTDVPPVAIVANGAAKSTTIATPGQRASFSFSGTNGQKISWQVTASDVTGFVELHRPDGSYAGSYTGAQINAFSDDVTLTVDGTWTFLVYGSSGDTGSVTMKLYTFTDVDGGTIVANGPTKSLTTTRPGQNGSFTVPGTNGQKISFLVTASDLAGFVELHRPDGSYAGTYACLANGCTAGPATLNVTGTWSLFVDGNGTDTGTANIKLT